MRRSASVTAEITGANCRACLGSVFWIRLGTELRASVFKSQQGSEAIFVALKVTVLLSDEQQAHFTAIWQVCAGADA